MSATIYLHGPHVFTAELIESPSVFVSLGTGDAKLFLRTGEDCDALTEAARDAKLLLAAHHDQEATS